MLFVNHTILLGTSGPSLVFVFSLFSVLICEKCWIECAPLQCFSSGQTLGRGNGCVGLDLQCLWWCHHYVPCTRVSRSQPGEPIKQDRSWWLLKLSATALFHCCCVFVFVLFCWGFFWGGGIVTFGNFPIFASFPLSHVSPGFVVISFHFATILSVFFKVLMFMFMPH